MPRVNPEVIKQNYQRTVASSSSNGAPTSSTQNYVLETRSRSYSSRNSPFFKSTPKYLLPWNNHQVQLDEYDHGTFSSRFYSQNNAYLTTGVNNVNWSNSTVSGPASVTLGLPSLAVIDRSRLIGQASTKALLNLKEQKVNLGQVYAERQQTVNLITSTATRIHTSYSRLRRFDYLGAADALGVNLRPQKRRRLANKAADFRRRRKSGTDFASNTWLEYSFGWVPLLSDIHGSLEKWVDYQKDRQPIVRVSGRSKESLGPKQVYTTNNQFTKQFDIIKANADVKVIYDFVISNDSFRNFSSFGLTNPLHLAWELIPFSFVVDWFLPVSNFLSSLDSTFGMTFKRGIYSSREEFDSTRTRSRSANSSSFSNFGGNIYSGFIIDVDGGSCRHRRFVYTRTALPFPVYTLPSLKNPFSVSHALSALALMKKTFGR